MAKQEWIKTYDSKKYGQQFRRRSDYLGVRIDTFKPSIYGYDVVINEASNYPLMSKNFKNRASAIKFAKKYMENN